MIRDSNGVLDVTVVCWIGANPSDLVEVHRAYREILVSLGKSAEFLYVLDGPRRRLEQRLSEIRDPRFPVRVLRMAKGFGESAGLQKAFDLARGRHILTIPDRFQADPAILPRILERLDAGDEVVVACRQRGEDRLLNRIQYGLFHRILARMSRRRLADVTSGLRGLDAGAARRLDLYGDLHRFLPVLAARRGFRVTEVPAPQHPLDRTVRLYPPGVYARRLLDVLNVFFLTRFTRKPLRFFGLIGLVVGSVGTLVCLVVALQRIISGTPLSDRPLLLLGVLLVVVAVQLVSLGLIGEIVLFLSSRRDHPEPEELILPTRDAQPLRAAEPRDERHASVS